MKALRYLLILLSLIIVSCESATEPKDCAGVAGGTAVLDECEICSGGTTGLTACPSAPSGTYILTSWIYQDSIDCSDGTNGCESFDCSETYLTFTDNSYIFQESDPYCDECGSEDCYETYTTEETCLAVEGAVWKTQTKTGTWTLNADNEIIGLIDEDEVVPEGDTLQWIFNQNTNTIVFTQIKPNHTNSSGEAAPLCMIGTLSP